jgi:hypothetical protein
LYAVPITPAASEEVVIVSGAAAFTVIVSCWLEVALAASLTVTVKVPLPPVGVPEIVTELLVLAPIVIPGGRLPEEMLHA